MPVRLRFHKSQQKPADRFDLTLGYQYGQSSPPRFLKPRLAEKLGRRTAPLLAGIAYRR